MKALRSLLFVLCLAALPACEAASVTGPTSDMCPTIGGGAPC